MHNSGKLLIVTMFVAALAAAATSWWFRYSATHHAAQFWGPEAARLIRDAPQVELLRLQPTETAADDTKSPAASPPSPNEVHIGSAVWRITARRDISAAHGLVHLRNALLEDSSFNWSQASLAPDFTCHTALLFRDPETSHPLSILLSSDFQLLQTLPPGDKSPRIVSCRPIAAGLAETTAEWSQDPAAP
jgi:hypothetical protein